MNNSNIVLKYAFSRAFTHIFRVDPVLWAYLEVNVCESLLNNKLGNRGLRRESPVAATEEHPPCHSTHGFPSGQNGPRDGARFCTDSSSGTQILHAILESKSKLLVMHRFAGVMLLFWRTWSGGNK